MKNNLILLFQLLCLSVIAQNQITPKTYITKDKLGYITIIDAERFEYLEYEKFSPLTIKEAREKEENKHQMCGTISYIMKDEGNGSYEIKDSELILYFNQLNDSNLNKSSRNVRYKLAELIIE